MLRELVDIAWLEDFVSGLARSSGLRICAFDEQGQLLVASPPRAAFTRLTGCTLGALPADMQMTPVPAHDPPAHVAYVEHGGVWSVVAPVYLDEQTIAYLAVGEFREHSPAGEHWRRLQEASGADLERLLQAWQTLPALDRAGGSHAVITARWGARLLADWSRRESRLVSASNEAALVGDIAALLTGEHDLQHVLDHIVSETAHVMQCPAASVRLCDRSTGELVLRAVHNLPQDYLDKGALMRVAGSVDDQALRGHVVAIDDAGNDPRVQYPENARRAGIVSMLTAGMIYRGEPVGVIRVYTRQKRRFRKAQRELLRAVANQAATAIVHARLVEERLKNVEIQRQLKLAGEIQARMARTPPPKHPRVRTARVFNPSYNVGGDFCDFLTLCDGRLAAVVADVVGKGIPASLLTSTVRGALRAAADWCCRPGDLLTHLNRQVCRETATGEFVTLLLIALDRDARQVTYSSAGHEPLLILRDGQVQETDEADLVLGVNPDEVYRDHAAPLRSGDFLLLYTDGVVEACNFADEQFGRARLHESLRAYGGLDAQQLLNNILWDVRRFVGLAEQSDDLTLVGLRIGGEPESSAG